MNGVGYGNGDCVGWGDSDGVVVSYGTGDDSGYDGESVVVLLLVLIMVLLVLLVTGGLLWLFRVLTMSGMMVRVTMVVLGMATTMDVVAFVTVPMVMIMTVIMLAVMVVVMAMVLVSVRVWLLVWLFVGLPLVLVIIMVVSTVAIMMVSGCDG